MKRVESQYNVMLLLGVMLLQTGISDLHLRYVKAGMQPLLVISGVVLLVLGALGIYNSLRERSLNNAEHNPPKTAWLLVLPFFVLVAAAPPSLGSYLAARQPTLISQPSESLGPLPALREGASDLTVTQFFARAAYEPESLKDATVRLVGFVTVVDSKWYITRIQMSCCAADGRPVKVLALNSPGATPKADTWVEVTGTSAVTSPRSDKSSGTFDSSGTLNPPESSEGAAEAPALNIATMRTVPEPRQTYDSPS